ncbi:hypothetical protein LIER_26984 [Lithospermum erythrorhizon]|uniref:Uncharacterized protein n=1 Tax=Lithospermum erythrorhizon TaxID=34254 RepID=A0AAV3RCE1_LITER
MEGGLDKSVEVVMEEEKEKLLEGVTVLDFDLLCSTVALQAEKGKWGTLNFNKYGQENDGDHEGGGSYGGVLRMWEGELFYDCFDDRRVAMESTCFPCYRFGKNMRRAGFGPCFFQGSAYLVLAVIAVVNMLTFLITGKHSYLYLSIIFTISVGVYLGFFRTQMKKKFNIHDNDSSFDDCVYHLICPCCTLSQESRTLEMNNVQDGIWHGRGDTICVGSYSDASNPFFQLNAPPIMSVNAPEVCIIQKPINESKPL